MNSSAGASGRAASCTATASASPAAASALRTDARAHGAALDEREAEREVAGGAAERLLGDGAVAGRDGDDRARHAGRGDGVERPGDHRPAGEGDERLRPAGAEPRAAARRDDDRGGVRHGRFQG